MLFGVKLANSIYPAWKDHYINYEKLKKLLKESAIDAHLEKAKKSKNIFTDQDESHFVTALDSELTKVYTFQSTHYDDLDKKIGELKTKIDEADLKTFNWTQFQQDLEDLLAESRELDHFARINFTGFQKIIKKHDRLHPSYTSVKALLSIRLKELPFNSEDHSPLLYKISTLFSLLRNNVQSASYFSGSASAPGSNLDSIQASIATNSYVTQENSEYQSFKFWIHPDNLMEVKTRILRHLPVLVYNSNADGSNTNSKLTSDPTITSLYFDNPTFEIYNQKLLKSNTSPSLRLRWSGQLSNKPDIFLEKKIVDKSSDDTARDIRLKIKEKYLTNFIINHNVDEFKHKTLEKFTDLGSNDIHIQGLEADIDDIDFFIKEHDLQPALRSVYTRTAFQIPGDNRVRITIDSDLLFIREDSFDDDRPIRNPNDWHRSDIDQNIANPYSLLRKNEYAKFPHSVMEIKIKNTSGQKKSEIKGISIPFSRKHGKWIEELTTSHLVKEVPSFSKFIQGTAALFLEDDRLDILPFWLPELEDDIRQDPNAALEAEELKKQKQLDIKSRIERLEAQSPDENTNGQSGDQTNTESEDHESSEDENRAEIIKRVKPKFKTTDLIPFLIGGSKLANVDSEDEEIELPQGVIKPKTLLKQASPVKIEAKVWLANERTFNSWLTVTSLFSTLTFSIYSSVKSSESETLATNLAYFYFFLTLFTGAWGYYIYNKRLTLIKQRDGKHLDAPLGPLVVAIGVLGVITINFIVGFRHAAIQLSINDAQPQLHPLVQWVNTKMFHLVGAQNY